MAGNVAAHEEHQHVPEARAGDRPSGETSASTSWPGPRLLQRAAGNQATLSALANGGEAVQEEIRTLLTHERGAPLDPATRQRMEASFDVDFGHVRLHTGSAAAESARSVGARGYTFGDQIVFGAGQYTPGSPSGERRLAHELTHVVQQAGAAAGNGLTTGSHDLALEGGAQVSAEHVAAGRAPGPIDAAPAVAVQREDDPNQAEAEANDEPWLVRRAFDAAEHVVRVPLGPLGGMFLNMMRGFVARGVKEIKNGDLWDIVKDRLWDVINHPVAFPARYALGALKGFISPITGLYDLAKFAVNLGEMGVAFTKRVLDGGESLAQDAKELGAKFSAFVESLKTSIQQVTFKDLVDLIMGGGGALEQQIRGLGRAAARRLFGFLRQTWTPDTGESIGHVVGEIVVNVVLFVFTDGIGNAITQVATRLGQIASKIPVIGEVAAQLMTVIGEIGVFITKIEHCVGGLMSRVLKPLEPVLKPLFELLEGLKKFLQRLFGVTERASAAGASAAGKAAGKALESPKPVPKPAPRAAPRTAPRVQPRPVAEPPSTTAPKVTPEPVAPPTATGSEPGVAPEAGATPGSTPAAPAKPSAPSRPEERAEPPTPGTQAEPSAPQAQPSAPSRPAAQAELPAPAPQAEPPAPTAANERPPGPAPQTDDEIADQVARQGKAIRADELRATAREVSVQKLAREMESGVWSPETAQLVDDIGLDNARGLAEGRLTLSEAGVEVNHKIMLSEDGSLATVEENLEALGKRAHREGFHGRKFNVQRGGMPANPRFDEELPFQSVPKRGQPALSPSEIEAAADEEAVRQYRDFEEYRDTVREKDVPTFEHDPVRKGRGGPKLSEAELARRARLAENRRVLGDAERLARSDPERYGQAVEELRQKIARGEAADAAAATGAGPGPAGGPPGAALPPPAAAPPAAATPVVPQPTTTGAAPPAPEPSLPGPVKRPAAVGAAPVTQAPTSTPKATPIRAPNQSPLTAPPRPAAAPRPAARTAFQGEPAVPNAATPAVEPAPTSAPRGSSLPESVPPGGTAPTSVPPATTPPGSPPPGGAAPATPVPGGAAPARRGPVVVDLQAGSPSFLRAEVAARPGAQGIGVEAGDSLISGQRAYPVTEPDLDLSRKIVQNTPEWPDTPVHTTPIGALEEAPPLRPDQLDPAAELFPSQGDVTILRGPNGDPVPFFPPRGGGGRLVPINQQDAIGLTATTHPELHGTVDQAFLRRPFALQTADAATRVAMGQEINRMLVDGGFVEMRVLASGDRAVAAAIRQQISGTRTILVNEGEIERYLLNGTLPPDAERAAILEAARPDLLGEFQPKGRGTIKGIIRMYKDVRAGAVAPSIGSVPEIGPASGLPASSPPASAPAVEPPTSVAPHFAPAPTLTETASAEDGSSATLVGTSQPTMRRQAAHLIREKPDHPLKFLLDEHGEFKSPSSLKHHALAEEPDIVQMSHIISKKSGEPERIMLGGAWENQVAGVTNEKPRTGIYAENVAVDIGGVAVELKTARFWESIGRLPPGTVAAARRVTP